MQNFPVCSSSSNNASASNAGINGGREFSVGYRFCPTDSELIVFYLKNKISNLPLPHDKIPSVNLYDHRPSELAESYEPLGDVGDGEWYFFTPRDRKYPNGLRPNRAADSGYWKATGSDQNIVSDAHKSLPKAEKKKKKVIGYRKTLVFYEGKPLKGKKTNWIMHEFRVNSSDAPQHVRQGASDMKLDDWVLCRIHNKEKKKRAAKEEDLFDDEDDDHQQNTMNNDQQTIMNNDQQNMMNNNQQSVTNNETGHSLARLPQYVDYNNQLDYSYTMQLQEPIYEEIYPADEEHLFNYEDVSNNPFLMKNFNNQIYSNETILQNAPYFNTNHHQQQTPRK